MQVVNEMLKDYEDYCHQQLSLVTGEQDRVYDDVIYAYQRYRFQLITECPRQVIVPDDLHIDEEHRQAYQQIVSRIENGEALWPYQSKNIEKVDFDDQMLCHWGVQHLHLGNTFRPDGFIKRTGPLLFAVFTDDKAYIVGFYAHQAWTKLSIIETIHKHWPKLLHEYKSDSCTETLTEQQIKVLRNKNANHTVVVSDGTQYLPPKGVNAAGAPIEVTMKSALIRNNLDHVFDVIKTNLKDILARDTEGQHGETITFGLIMDATKKKLIYRIKETDFAFSLKKDPISYKLLC